MNEERKKLLVIAIFFGLILILGIFIIVNTVQFYSHRGILDDNFVTGTKCNFETKCPVGMGCLKFPENFYAICASPDVSLYYKCPENTNATLAKNVFPSQVVCK